MGKDNGTYTSSDDDENMLVEESVDSIPSTAIELKYYIDGTKYCYLNSKTYFLDGTVLYSKLDNGSYYSYDLQPIRYMRIPLRLSDKSIELAEIELLLDTSKQDEKYINELQQYVYSKSGSRKYYRKQIVEDDGSIPDFLLSEDDL